MARIRFGVVRNGEHLSIHATREEAEAQVEVEKAENANFAREGWLTAEQAREARYHVQEVKGRHW